jgi:Flp pilus assembly protein TadD
MGYSYMAMNDKQNAAQVFQTLAQQNPNSSQMKLLVAQLYDGQGDFSKATAEYQQVIALQPRDAVAKNNLAWLYAEHGGNIDVALKLAQEAKEIAPDDPRIADTLGWICLKKGAYESAVTYFKESLTRMPDNPTYRYHMGLAYYRMGDMPKAKQSLTAALNRPGFSEAADARKLLSELH